MTAYNDPGPAPDFLYPEFLEPSVDLLKVAQAVREHLKEARVIDPFRVTKLHKNVSIEAPKPPAAPRPATLNQGANLPIPRNLAPNPQINQMPRQQNFMDPHMGSEQARRKIQEATWQRLQRLQRQPGV